MLYYIISYNCLFKYFMIIDKLKILPIDTKFKLGDTITNEQKYFLDYYGFLHFKNVASKEEIDMLISEISKIEEIWLKENRKEVYGIPLFWGKTPEGKPFLQRFAFASVFSEKIKNFVRDKRFEPIRKLISDDARIGDEEKDGVVINVYINLEGSVRPKLGWHTDGLRDLFYGRMPQQMLNVGLHFDKCYKDNGGLRLIPCSHNQGFFDMFFKKLYFVSHDEDIEEIAVETDIGDLTVHDGRLWHRVAPSNKLGIESLRRTMYVPYLTGPYEPKSEDSKTPFYHYLGKIERIIKNKLFSIKNKK